MTSSGSEDVDGRSLDRYLLTVDTTQLGGQTDTTGLPAEMQITVWLDDEDRMAKTSMGMGAVQYDASLSDFDKTVDLEAPPKDQVVSTSRSLSPFRWSRDVAQRLFTRQRPVRCPLTGFRDRTSPSPQPAAGSWRELPIPRRPGIRIATDATSPGRAAKVVP